MLKIPSVKNILSAVTVTGVGYVLLNLVFLFYALVAWVLEEVTPGSPLMKRMWIGPISLTVATILIAFISWFIFRSKLATLYKAIYMTVPSAIVFTIIGITLYRWPVLAYTAGILLGAGIMIYFYLSKKPWLYYYVLISVGLALAVSSLLGAQI